MIFGDELRGAALEALPLVELALVGLSAEAAAEARKKYVDALQRQVRSSNSPPKPSINENPYTYIVERPTLEIGRPAARSGQNSLSSRSSIFEFDGRVAYGDVRRARPAGCRRARRSKTRAEASRPGNRGRRRGLEGQRRRGRSQGAARKAGFPGRAGDVPDRDRADGRRRSAGDELRRSSGHAGQQRVAGSIRAPHDRPSARRAPIGWSRIRSPGRWASIWDIQGQLKNVFKDIAEKVEGYAGLSHNFLANEGATPIKRAQADLSKVNRAELMERLAGEVARVNRNVPVDLVGDGGEGRIAFA